MGDKSDQSIMDKSMRSVFVGNIPYEATEEKLKDIFSEVGPVISLKLVFDRESGKPKGYGFCEYKDQETALSAMRNLNGYEIGGRALRVDNACTEKSRMEMAALLQGPQIDNPYGDPCDPCDAPEIITKTVVSLPPERLYELMKQMKTCIQNNPVEARQMLLQNPQMAYALLQAQVVMRIVDPATAVTFLHKSNQMPPIIISDTMSIPAPQHSPAPVPVPAPMPVPPVGGSSAFSSNVGHDVDLRNADPRIGRQINLDQDMRSLSQSGNMGGISSAMDSMGGGFNQRGGPPPRPIGPQVPPQSNPFPMDPRQRPVDPRQGPKDPRQQPGGVGPSGRPGPSIAASSAVAASAAAAASSNGIPNDASDQEKAALIMQVLQLSDEQIAMLPPEQRTSILVLKEQIAKSTQR
ncbi:cleavage stimulation factor subunit 2 tau variant [Toxorhynchites rutilus septentrionalis]|uniref:cleavage stimulation factor subunit 2 tau variant n=1 Tax=Toxorhynchites rutilus septentrionalis TaxID=329112 RepID=UPI00247AAB4E|nr:cleavage stimulation factor subunit 2 tau variant [Toxorhynchites rutilus septentrionalis]